MANHKSAAKRARQTTRRTAVNNKRKSAVRTFEKSIMKALSEKKVSDLPALLKSYKSLFSKAARQGVVSKQKMARKIGRMSAKVHALVGSK